MQVVAGDGAAHGEDGDGFAEVDRAGSTSAAAAAGTTPGESPR